MKTFVIIVFATATSILALEDGQISARIESCRGCSLNRLPEVKNFVLNDAPNYDKVEVKFITGAPPELVILGQNDKEMERLPLSQLTREQCNELLQGKGFSKKNKNTEF